MVFVANQEQNETYTFKDMLSQPDKSISSMEIPKEVDSNEILSHLILLKNS